MRQIVGTASNNYDMIDASGHRYPCVELVVMSLEVDYESTAMGLKRVENHRTDRYHLRIDQLKAVIEQLNDIVTQAADIRDGEVEQ